MSRWAVCGSRITLLLLSSMIVANCARSSPGSNPGAEAAQAPANVPLASNPTVGQELGAVADNRIAVLFPEGGIHVASSQARQLDLAARLFRDAKPVNMFVSGYADATGNEFGNLVVSARRAQAVKEGLVARGIPADRLLLRAYGVSDPVEMQEPRSPDNCRVIVTWRLL